MKLIERIRQRWAKRSSLSYIKYIRNRGVKIGENCQIRDPRSFTIDLQRAHLITIGNLVSFNKDNRLICHDAIAQLFRQKFQDYLPSNGHITIGNNVQFAQM